MTIEVMRRALLVVHNNQLWNFISVVSVLHAWARLDVWVVSRKMVSSFGGTV